MLLNKFNDKLTSSELETNVYLSDDYSQVIISQCLYRGSEILSFNEVSVPLHDFAASATAISKKYVKHFLDEYKLE
jgi:hypothetical protein|tara:strand:- start:2338 stop:2565 length:228 start_codon:yes stop_codon:yes gene_type:complete